MKYIIAFLISMTPLVELRGAVPIAIRLRYSLVAGPCPLYDWEHASSSSIFFFARRVLKWGADKPLIGGFFTWCLKKGP